MIIDKNKPLIPNLKHIIEVACQRMDADGLLNVGGTLQDYIKDLDYIISLNTPDYYIKIDSVFFKTELREIRKYISEQGFKSQIVINDKYQYDWYDVLRYEFDFGGWEYEKYKDS